MAFQQRSRLGDLQSDISRLGAAGQNEKDGLQLGSSKRDLSPASQDLMTNVTGGLGGGSKGPAHERRSLAAQAIDAAAEAVAPQVDNTVPRRSLAEQAIDDAAASVAQRALGTHARRGAEKPVRKSREEQQKGAESLIEDLHRESKMKEAELRSVRLDLELTDDKIVSLKRQILTLKRKTWLKFFSITPQLILEEWRIIIQRKQNEIALEHLQTQSMNEMRDKADRMMRVVGLMSSGANVVERCFTGWKMSKFSTPMEREVAERQAELKTIEDELAGKSGRVQQLQNLLKQRQQEVDLQTSFINEELDKKKALDEEARLAEIESEQLIASVRAAGALEVSRKEEEGIASEQYLSDLRRQAQAYMGINGEVDPRSVVLALARKVMPLAGHADIERALHDLVNATGVNALSTGSDGDFLDETSEQPLARPPLMPANFRFDKESRQYRAAKSNPPLARLVAEDPGGLVAALALSIVGDMETRLSIAAQKRAEEKSAEGLPLHSTLRSDEVTENLADTTKTLEPFEPLSLVGEVETTKVAESVQRVRLVGRQRLDTLHQFANALQSQQPEPSYFSLGDNVPSIMNLRRPPSPPNNLHVGNLQPLFQAGNASNALHDTSFPPFPPGPSASHDPNFLPFQPGSSMQSLAVGPGAPTPQMVPGAPMQQMARGGPMPQMASEEPMPQMAPGAPIPQMIPEAPMPQMIQGPQMAPGVPMTQMAPGGPMPQMAPGEPVSQMAPGGPMSQMAPGGPMPQMAPAGPMPQMAPGGPMPQMAPGGPMPQMVNAASALQDGSFLALRGSSMQSLTPGPGAPMASQPMFRLQSMMVPARMAQQPPPLRT